MTTGRAVNLLKYGRRMPDFCDAFSDIDEACEIACHAIQEKIERDNPKPLTWDEMKRLNEVPVYILDLYDEGREGWYILSWDYRKSGQYLVLSSRHCNGFLSDDYGESWVAYKNKPTEV